MNFIIVILLSILFTHILYNLLCQQVNARLVGKFLF